MQVDEEGKGAAAQAEAAPARRGQEQKRRQRQEQQQRQQNQNDARKALRPAPMAVRIELRQWPCCGSTAPATALPSAAKGGGSQHVPSAQTPPGQHSSATSAASESPIGRRWRRLPSTGGMLTETSAGSPPLSVTVSFAPLARVSPPVNVRTPPADNSRLWFLKCRQSTRF